MNQNLESNKIQYSKIGIISLAHMLNDLYSNYIPQMLPFLVVLYDDFNATKAAIVVSAFSITSSFTNHFFGYFMDKQGKRWLAYIGTLWMAALLSLTGLVHNYLLLVILAALAGLGTAVFHPQLLPWSMYSVKIAKQSCYRFLWPLGILALL